MEVNPTLESTICLSFNSFPGNFFIRTPGAEIISHTIAIPHIIFNINCGYFDMRTRISFYLTHLHIPNKQNLQCFEAYVVYAMIMIVKRLYINLSLVSFRPVFK